MAVSFQKYQKALELLKTEQDDEVLSGLADIVDEYEKGGLGFPEGAYDVPTAKQAEAKKAGEIQPGAFDVPTAEETARRQGEAIAKEPALVKAIKLREGMSGGTKGQSKLTFESLQPQGLNEIGPLPQEVSEHAKNRLNLQREMAGFNREAQPRPWEGPAYSDEDRGKAYNDRSQTASHRVEFERPPEYIPPAKAQPLDFFGHLEDAARLLPSYASNLGAAEHFLEPSIQQFRRDMARTYGPQVMMVTEQSPEFQEYADKLWKDIYDQAAAQGRPVVREKYRKREGITENVIGGARDVQGKLTAGAVGASEAMPFNLPARAVAATGLTSLENLEKVAETSPTMHDIGFGVAAASPLSTGNLALKAGGALVPEAVQLMARAPKAAQIVAGEGSKGFVSGAGQQLGTDLERGNFEGAGTRAFEAGGYGVIPSILGGLAMRGLAHEGQKLRREGPLGEAEKIGASASVFKGVKPGPVLENLRDEARIAGLGPEAQPDVESLLVGRLTKLEKPLVREGRRIQATEEARVGAALKEFHNINANEKRAPGKYISALSELHKDVTDDFGIGLPENEQIADQLRNKLNKLVDVHLVPHGTPEEQAAFWKSDAEHQAFDEARMGERFETKDPFATPVGEGKTAVAGEKTVSNEFGTEKTTPTPTSTREAERTAPGGRPTPVGEKTLPDEVTPVGLSDLEFPTTTPREKSPLPYDRTVTRLRELEKEHPGSFAFRDKGPGQSAVDRAEKEGFSVYEAIGKAYGKDATWARENYPTLANKFDVVIAPKTFRPKEFHAVVQGVDVANKPGARVQPDPRLVARTSRAIREDRDKFTGSSPRIPRTIEKTIEDAEGKPIQLRGYSAYEAISSDELAALKRRLHEAGLPETVPDTLTSDQADRLEATIRQHGRKGQTQEAREALVGLAESADRTYGPVVGGSAQTLDQLKRARAVAELEKAAKITQMFRGYGSVINPVERMTAMGLRLRLDPMLQFLAPKLGGLGAAGATGPQREYRNRLPPQADEATIQQISELLGFGP